MFSLATLLSGTLPPPRGHPRPLCRALRSHPVLCTEPCPLDPPRKGEAIPAHPLAFRGSKSSWCRQRTAAGSPGPPTSHPFTHPATDTSSFPPSLHPPSTYPPSQQANICPEPTRLWALYSCWGNRKHQDGVDVSSGFHASLGEQLQPNTSPTSRCPGISALQAHLMVHWEPRERVPSSGVGRGAPKLILGLCLEGEEGVC